MAKRPDDAQNGCLSGKVALVLGGTGQIGEAVCQVLAGRGAALVVQHSRIPSATTRSKVTGTGPVLQVGVDAGAPGAAHAVVTAASGDLGPIDIVVNSYHPKFEPVPIADSDFERDWCDHLAALRFYVEVTVAVLPAMRQAQWGRFVLVSGALSARPLPGCAAYGTVKAGLHSFHRHLAQEEGTNGITANAVAPGRVAASSTAKSTAWNQANGAASPRAALPFDPDVGEVAAMVAHFCGPQASGITGQVVYIARGEVMSG